MRTPAVRLAAAAALSGASGDSGGCCGCLNNGRVEARFQQDCGIKVLTGHDKAYHTEKMIDLFYNPLKYNTILVHTLWTAHSFASNDLILSILLTPSGTLHW